MLNLISYLFRTLTSPVELIKCLETIRDHAFASSPYPVVITLEDHLTADLQANVAKVILFSLLILWLMLYPCFISYVPEGHSNFWRHALLPKI